MYYLSCVPLIDSKDLINSFKLVNKNYDKYCFPIAEYSSPIQRALTLNQENETSSFYPEFENQKHKIVYKHFLI